MVLAEGITHKTILTHYKTVEDDMRKAHNNYYTYEKAIYYNTNTPIEVTCPEHGSFWVAPNNHMLGRRCVKCFREINTSKRRFTLEQFIDKCRGIHNNKFTYEKVMYINDNTKVEVTCPEHGSFWASPNKLYQGRGCPKCKLKNSRDTQEDFIRKANEVHGDTFKYDRVQYKSSKDKVLIGCIKHGYFSQTPNAHLQGRKCPECSKENFIPFIKKYKNKPTLFYYFKYKGLYKIGITTNSVEKRYSSEGIDFNDIKILYIKQFKCYTEAIKYESFLKNKYKEFLYEGDFIFKNTQNTEVFTKDILKKEETESPT